jgi:hypothetical protein
LLFGIFGLFGLFGLYTTTQFGDVVDGTIKAPTLPPRVSATGMSLYLDSNGVANSPVALVTALAYGGMNSDGTPAANVIYAARSNAIYVRTSTNAGNSFDYSASVSTDIQSIVLDPNNWKVAYAVGAGAVYATVDGGKNWKNITGQLAPFNSGLDAVQLIKANGHDYLLVGGADGVFVTQDPLGVPTPTQKNNYQKLPSGPPVNPWTALNAIPTTPDGVQPGLPHVLVTQISYTPSMTLTTPGGPEKRGDVLLISTLGRGRGLPDFQRVDPIG